MSNVPLDTFLDTLGTSVDMVLEETTDFMERHDPGKSRHVSGDYSRHVPGEERHGTGVNTPLKTVQDHV